MPATRQIFISYARHDGIGLAQARNLHARLERAGFACFRDEQDIAPGPWPAQLAKAIDDAEWLLCVVSAGVHRSDWVGEELVYAQQKAKPIIPVRVQAGVELPFGLNRLQAVDLDAPDGWQRLLDWLHGQNTPRRRLELDYLRDEVLFRGQGLFIAEQTYTPLEGEARRHRTLARLQPEACMEMDFALLRRLALGDAPAREAAPERYDDVLKALRVAPRLAVLGEPGAGKTFALLRIAAEQARNALDDPAVPLPIFVPLKEWVAVDERLDDFIARHAGPLAGQWAALLEERRLHLLLDGLNELPTAQRAAKMGQVRDLARDPRLACVVASCRRNDFVGDLHLDLDTLDIRPLDPPRIRTFIHRYLEMHDPGKGAEQAEALFWHLAGGDGVREAWEVWQAEGVAFERFWTVETLEQELPDLFKKIWWTAARWRWRKMRADPRNLLRLAANPFLLRMMVAIGSDNGARLPDNRARLIAAFVAFLLQREQQRHQQVDAVAHPGRDGLEAALGCLAWNLQHRAGGPDNVQLALPRNDLDGLLSPDQLRLAQAASLVEADETVRFTHQLLQEYFTALGMQAEMENRRLAAADLWPPGRWWKRTGWEEATVFMAGLNPDAPVPLADWLADAQPAVLMQCLAESGCRPLTAQDIKNLRLAERWRPRIDQNDARWEPAPEARNPIALALGRLGLDDRFGIGLDARGIPEIHWVAIPGGEFLYGEEKQRRRVKPFRIARYLVTNAQFQAFIDAGGYQEGRWWQELAERIAVPDPSRWSEPNRPRETVSWYEAVAFCRWLSDRLGYEVRLPTEEEWERAARGSDGREYPWGDGYRAGHANIDETSVGAGPHYLQATSVVGLYPQGVSPNGVLDLAGNLWEWCLNEYEKPNRTQDTGAAARVRRGGSWFGGPGDVRAAGRNGFTPVGRLSYVGLRVVCSASIR